VRALNLKGENNPCWRGGRIKTSEGYVFIKLQPDNFFYPMANKPRGYVMEHRLVMAKHLGRCLHRWEILHHKGIRYTGKQNKSDNLIDNLELTTQGSHSLEHSKGYRDGYQKGLYDGHEARIKQLESRVTLLEAENIILKQDEQLIPGRNTDSIA